MDKVRADVLLAEFGFFDSRARAALAIKEGKVKVDGKTLKKPSELIDPDADIDTGEMYEWVSRSGQKLVQGLEAFEVNPHGLVCLDVGASTGGFSEVLLHYGAATIYAVDVGTDQLHERLRDELRIISLEQTDARNLTPEIIPDAPDLIVCDASFISLEKVLPAALALAKPRAKLIALFKPQFEVGRQHLTKTGVVKSDKVAGKKLQSFQSWLLVQGWLSQEAVPSLMKGKKGNQEWLVYASKR